MIAFLTGRLISKKPTHIIIDVNGVGYGVFVSLQTFYALGDTGDKVGLSIYTHVREDVIQLFGFEFQGEKDVFERLIGVSKIGPKLAITILSGIPCPQLVEAIGRNDLAKLSSIPGVGKKTAERLVLELKDKFPEMTAIRQSVAGHETGGSGDDAVRALISLGYKKVVAEQAVKEVLTKDGGMNLETILRESLNQLS